MEIERGSTNLCAIDPNTLEDLEQLKLENGQLVAGWLHNHIRAGPTHNPMMFKECVDSHNRLQQTFTQAIAEVYSNDQASFLKFQAEGSQDTANEKRKAYGCLTTRPELDFKHGVIKSNRIELVEPKILETSSNQEQGRIPYYRANA